jgi:hypothetical protein
MRAKEFITRNMRPATASGQEKPGAVQALKQELEAAKAKGTKFNYDVIDKMMQRISKEHNLTGQQLHDQWMAKYHKWPDTWVKEL